MLLRKSKEEKNQRRAEAKFADQLITLLILITAFAPFSRQKLSHLMGPGHCGVPCARKDTLLEATTLPSAPSVPVLKYKH